MCWVWGRAGWGRATVVHFISLPFSLLPPSSLLLSFPLPPPSLLSSSPPPSPSLSLPQTSSSSSSWRVSRYQRWLRMQRRLCRVCVRSARTEWPLTLTGYCRWGEREGGRERGREGEREGGREGDSLVPRPLTLWEGPGYEARREGYVFSFFLPNVYSYIPMFPISDSPIPRSSSPQTSSVCPTMPSWAS